MVNVDHEIHIHCKYNDTIIWNSITGTKHFIGVNAGTVSPTQCSACGGHKEPPYNLGNFVIFSLLG
jgi:hypothetical protein